MTGTPSVSPRPGRPARIEVHVQELVLYGFGGMSGLDVGAAVESQLGRLLEQRGAPSAWFRGALTPRLNGEVELHPQAGASLTGKTVAEILYGMLGR